MMDEENYDVEIASEGYDDSEIDYIERKSRSRERGPDKKPRTYRPNSMSNLAQFKERPEAFVQYLKDVKGVDITGNSGIGKALLILAIVLGVVFGGAWLYNRYKNRKDNEIESR